MIELRQFLLKDLDRDCWTQAQLVAAIEEAPRRRVSRWTRLRLRLGGLFMPIRVSYFRANDVAQRIAGYFPELTAEPRPFGNKGYYVAISKDGADSGLLLHPDELDNGASGLRDEALERLLAFRDGTPWEPKPKTSGKLVYDDVMTTQNFGG